MAAALADIHFEVRLLPMFQTSIQLLKSLDQEGPVDLIRVSSLAGAHKEMLTELLNLLNERNLDISVVAGGVISKADARQLLGLEVKACFGPGQEVIEIIKQLVDLPLTVIRSALHQLNPSLQSSHTSYRRAWTFEGSPSSGQERALCGMQFGLGKVQASSTAPHTPEGDHLPVKLGREIADIEHGS